MKIKHRRFAIRWHLLFAGSDSAVVPYTSDLKTFSALGVFGLLPFTSVTAQNTQGVRGIQAISPEIVEGQINAVFEDLTVDAVKIGMLHNTGSCPDRSLLDRPFLPVKKLFSIRL